MGGSVGAGGAAAGGATVPGAGGVGPVLPAGGRGPFAGGMMGRIQQLLPMLSKGGMLNPEEQMLDTLARRGPPPQIPVIGPGAPGTASARVGAALGPIPGRGVLPQPIRMPMTRGEALTKPPMGIGAALGGGY